jgi:hypothetical protein
MQQLGCLPDPSSLFTPGKFVPGCYAVHVAEPMSDELVVSEKLGALQASCYNDAAGTPVYM